MLHTTNTIRMRYVRPTASVSTASLIIGMFVYQVLLLPWLLSALRLSEAQSPPIAVGDISVLCKQVAQFYCISPCVLQNGICFLPTAAASVNGTNYSLPGVPPCLNQFVTSCYPIQVFQFPCQNQPSYSTPCLNQPVVPAPFPNQPLTPYPPVLSQPTPCPNQPVTPYPPVSPQPAPYPNQPYTPNPPVLSQPAPCPNQPVTPYPPVSPQPAPYPNQHYAPYPPVLSQPTPCPNQPVTPYPPVSPQPAPYPNQPLTPYPPVLSQPAPCPNQPVTPYPPVLPETAPWSNQPDSPYLPTESQPQLPYPTQPATTTEHFEHPTHHTTQKYTEPSTTITRATTISPAPSPIRRCPNGTELINGNCRLVYCRSRILVNGRCVKTLCPTGTYWTGQKCAPPEPIDLAPLHIGRTIINKKSEKTPDLVLNNVQSLLVNASITLTSDYSDHEEEEGDETEVSETSDPPKCCTVIGPRTCRCPMESNRWQCYNTRQKHCGDFCSSPKMVLRPPTVSTWYADNYQMMTLPPNITSKCQQNGNCSQTADRYDCSGCASGQMAYCSSYCYSYRCISPNCVFYDQDQFCDAPQFESFVGCRSEDGWRR